MKLELSRNEMETLLELAYLGEWMANADHPAEREARFDAVLQKLYSAAEDQGLGYLVEADEETGDFHPSDAFDAKMDSNDTVGHYDEHVFWDELAVRLAERDLRKEMGQDIFESMRPVEREAKVDERAAAYDQEFDKKGIDRLQIEGLRAARPRRDRLSERLRKLFEE